VSVSVPEIGSAKLGWQAPGQFGLLNVSSLMIEPPARLIVRRSHAPPHAALCRVRYRLGGEGKNRDRKSAQHEKSVHPVLPSCR
jgi:hypothetical protein